MPQGEESKVDVNVAPIAGSGALSSLSLSFFPLPPPVSGLADVLLFVVVVVVLLCFHKG